MTEGVAYSIKNNIVKISLIELQYYGLPFQLRGYF